MITTNECIKSEIQDLKYKIIENFNLDESKLNFIDCEQIKKIELLKTNSTNYQVFSGTYNEHNISIKEFSTMKVINNLFDNLLHEINSASKTTHPNVPKFYGIGFNNLNVFLVYDLIKGESLKKKCDGLNLKEKINLLIQIASIIADLHKINITHKGIRTNKFIYNSTENKLFLKDLSEVSYEKGTSSNCLTDHEDKNNYCSYFPPEYFENNYDEEDSVEETEESVKLANELNSKFDVWSLGCVISEITSGDIPWSNYSSNDSSHKKTSKVKAMDYLLKKKNFPIPDTLPNEIKDILSQCMKIKSLERITTNELLEQLQKYYESL